MDKELLINFYRAFVNMRANICNQNNIELLQIMYDSLISGGDNILFVSSLKKSTLSSDEINNFISESSGSKVVDNKLNKILIYALENLIILFSNDSVFVYDIIDAIHILPDIIVSKGSINYKHIAKIYFKPLHKKWNLPLTKNLLTMVSL